MRLKKGHFSDMNKEIKRQYKRWCQYVKNLLLSIMILGPVERGEAKLFISYEEISNRARSTYAFSEKFQ